MIIKFNFIWQNIIIISVSFLILVIESILTLPLLFITIWSYFFSRQSHKVAAVMSLVGGLALAVFYDQFWWQGMLLMMTSQLAVKIWLQRNKNLIFITWLSALLTSFIWWRITGMKVNFTLVMYFCFGILVIPLIGFVFEGGNMHRKAKMSKLGQLINSSV